MSRSPSRSVGSDVLGEMAKGPAITTGSLAPTPMPSLTSHPPLRLQRKPVPGTILKRLPRILSPHPASFHPVTASQTGPPSYNAESPPPARKNPAGVNSNSCPFCPAVFKKVSHLNRHVLKHTGTRFPCEVPGCDKTFSRLDNMRTQCVFTVISPCI